MPEKLHEFSKKVKQIEFDRESLDSKAEMHARDSVRQIKAIQRDLLPDFANLLIQSNQAIPQAPPTNMLFSDLETPVFEPKLTKESTVVPSRKIKFNEAKI